MDTAFVVSSVQRVAVRVCLENTHLPSGPIRSHTTQSMPMKGCSVPPCLRGEFSLRLRRRQALALAAALVPGCRGRTYEPVLRYRWVYVSRNLLTDANLPAIEAVMRRAKAAGYNGVALAD